MNRKSGILLSLGAIFFVLPFLFEGTSLLAHTGEHVIHDLTEDLWVHVFLLGIVFLVIAAYQEIKSRG